MSVPDIEALNITAGDETENEEEKEQERAENDSSLNKLRKGDDNSKIGNIIQDIVKEKNYSNISFNSSFSNDGNRDDISSLSTDEMLNNSEKETNNSDDSKDDNASGLQYTIQIQKELIFQLKEEKKSIQTKLSNAEELCQTLQAQKNSLQSKVKSLISKNSQLQNEISKLKESTNNDSNNSDSNNNSNSKNNNEVLAHFQKENQKLLDEYQQLSDKYLELKAQNRNQQHNSYNEIQKKINDINKLQSEIQEKNDEIDNLKRTSDKTIKKLQQEVDRLKLSEEEHFKKIQILGKKQKPSPKASSNENISELKKQNEILKRKNDLISQNFELERIELQTMLDQKEALVKTLNTKLNSKSSSNEQSNSGTSRNLDLLRAENKQLKERIFSLSSSNYSKYSSSMALDKFKSKSSQINLTIYRQFSKINSKMLTLNSKISLLQYRLKMKKKRNADLINDQNYYYDRYTPQRPRKFAALV